MGPRMRRTLVIDASVLGASGTTKHPVSKLCRDFLDAVLNICHRAVLCNDLMREWKDHSSKYSVQWRTAMTRKSKIVKKRPEEVLPIENELSSVFGSQWKNIDDTHLIVLALAADEIVVSLDESARKGFMDVSTQAPKVGHVCWVNPSKESEDAVRWVESGAKSEGSRRLSYGVRISISKSGG